MRRALGGCGSRNLEEDREPMQSPTKLRVFHEAEELAVEVYRLTRTLPTDERYGLCQQMRRAGVSVVSNIAEGCGRGGNRELVRFLSIALGSATELEAQLRLARRLEYLAADDCQPVEEHARRVQRMLTSLIVRLRPALGASRGRP
jgi:four helix bundle protein